MIRTLRKLTIVKMTKRRESRRFKLIKMENQRARLHESKPKNYCRTTDRVSTVETVLEVKKLLQQILQWVLRQQLQQVQWARNYHRWQTINHQILRKLAPIPSTPWKPKVGSIQLLMWSQMRSLQRNQVNCHLRVQFTHLRFLCENLVYRIL